MREEGKSALGNRGAVKGDGPDAASEELCDPNEWLIASKRVFLSVKWG